MGLTLSAGRGAVHGRAICAMKQIVGPMVDNRAAAHAAVKGGAPREIFPPNRISARTEMPYDPTKI